MNLILKDGSVESNYLGDLYELPIAITDVNTDSFKIKQIKIAFDDKNNLLGFTGIGLDYFEAYEILNSIYEYIPRDFEEYSHIKTCLNIQ